MDVVAPLEAIGSAAALGGDEQTVLKVAEAAALIGGRTLITTVGIDGDPTIGREVDLRPAVECFINTGVIAAHGDTAFVARGNPGGATQGDKGIGVFGARTTAALEHDFGDIPPADHLVVQGVDDVIVNFAGDPVGIGFIADDFLDELLHVLAVVAVA